MAASREQTVPRAAIGVVAAAAVLIFLWAFPLFHVVSLKVPAGGGPALHGAVAFDPAAAASKIWQRDLTPAAQRAVELKSLARLLRNDPAGTKKKHAQSTGFGTAYYFVRGSGKVIARDRNYVRVVLDGAEPTIVAIRIGPVFGNTVRDGCGLLDLNTFPGLQEFNALAAELNALVEKKVLPQLHEKAIVGASVHFAGCAEAPETVGGSEEPLLTLIPVEAEVR